MSNQREILADIVNKVLQKKIEISDEMDLKKDLHIDSVHLVQLAIQIHDQFGVDLGEKFDNGFKVNTFKDLLLCIQK